jgi:hypothetical protein
MLVGASTLARAHDGHGFDGSHWHASDAFGLALVGAVVALWLLSRRK